MKHRIRVAAIIVKDNKILLVKHVDPYTNKEWWIPPGGGMEEIDSNIHACAIRETWEETGYNIETSDILYINEFIDNKSNTLNLGIFLKGNIKSGSATIKNIYGKGIDEFYIKEVKWLTFDEIKELIILPSVIKTVEFWENIKKNSNNTINYLGRD